MATATRVKHSKLDRIDINQGLTVVYPDPDQPPKSPSEAIKVDIVAVPGLGANPEFTWKSKNKVDWLRDSNMLPVKVTNARIMVFEYESQWFGRGSINQRLSSVADQLVQALYKQRSRGAKRPIVFVCHCLGGIVVEKAMVTAKLRQSDYPNIFMSVVGCVFLGTPFRGTKSTNKATLLAQMAETVGLGADSGLVRVLEETSEILKDLLSDFSAIAKESNMHIFCFFEQHASDLINLVFKGSYLKHKEMIVEEDSAHIDGYQTGALASDHFGLNKFTGPKDGRYISVSGEIKVAVQKADGILKSRQNAIRQTLIDDGTYQTILDTLKATDPQKDLDDSLRGRTKNEDSWVLGNENYLEWEEAKDSKILWIHGNAGKGQPIIACSVMHHLENREKETEGFYLAYFFCDEKDSHRRTIRDVLKLLIRQMVLKNRDLAEYLLVDDHTGKKGTRRAHNFDSIPLASLWGNLRNILRDSAVEKVFFIVNAFDETDIESRKEFMSQLEPYLEPRSEEPGDDETNVKWMFLSRSGRPDIEKSLTKALTICMEDKENADLVNDSVKREISDQVDEIARRKGLNDALTYLMKKYVYLKADGNYIYAHLVVQEFKNLQPSQTSISTVRKHLEDLPYGLTNMFEFMRHQVLDPKNEGIEYTKELLRCMILAEEAPTLFELALIADLPCEVRNDEDALRGHIRQCGAFLTTTTDEDGLEIVEWVDVIAKQHLNTYAKEELSLTQNDVQHGVIALRCLEHVRSVYADKYFPQNDDLRPPEQNNLAKDASQERSTGAGSQNDIGQKGDYHDIDLETNARKAGKDSTNESTTPSRVHDVDDAAEPQSETFQEQDPPLGYAVDYWLKHAMQAPIDVVEEFNLSDEFWTEGSVTRAGWWSQYSEGLDCAGVTGITSLHLAALTGYSALLNHLLEHGRIEELHKIDSWGYTPLSWACDYGDISSVDRLLKAGADLNHLAENGGPSALWAAAFSSHTDIVQFLVEQGAEVNWQSEGRGTPLYTAVSKNSTDIVRLLLEHGADANQKGGEHFRPLNIAAYSGHREIVRILLACGIEVSPDDDYRYGNALGAAAREGYADIVRILLQNGWSANRKMKTYNSPLVAAATYGHAEVVQALLQNGTEGSSQVQALEIASKKGRTDVVETLLAHTPFLRHQKAFQNAATYGRDDVLELLQKRGTNAEMLNTALYDASDHEMESTVNLLFELGADPNAEGKEYKDCFVVHLIELIYIHRYGNALQAAAFDGSIGIVKSLLAYRADVNKQGGDYGTALQAAAWYGHEDIARILLDHGAQVNTIEPIGYYGGALQAACSFRNANLVELLIDHGADVDACGGLYGSPIMAAVDESMQDNVEILVRHEANVNVNHVRYRHAPLLVMAGHRLGKEPLQRLLDHGANIEGTDDEGTTVLIATAGSGDKESLEMLLARGANIHSVSRTLGTAMSAAASEGDEECLRVLLDHGGDSNQDCGEWGTALQAAAYAADLDCINMLLEAGADVNKGNAENGHPLQAAASSGNFECLQRLLYVGANVNAVGDNAGCALAEAARRGHVKCLKLLLEHGADANLQCGTYQCALQAACATENNSECVKTLLEHGASTKLDGGLYGSLMQAAAFGGNDDLIDLLIEHGAGVDVNNGKYGNALQAAAVKTRQNFVLRLLELQVEVNANSGKYGTALQAAASASDADTVTILLQHDANPQIEGGLYGNALNAAARRANIDVLNYLLEPALPSDMLDGALLQAVFFRRDEAVKVLLKKGANVETTDEELGSPSELLQKSAGVDDNSDFGDDEDEDEDDISDTLDEDDNENESDALQAGNDEEDGSANDETDNGASVADLELEDPAESKIQKYLEDAKANVSSLRGPTMIQRKPVTPSTGVSQIPESTAQYDVYGVSKPQQPDSVDRSPPLSSNHWEDHSQPQYRHPDQPSTYDQTAPDAPVSNRYVEHSSRPETTSAYTSYDYQAMTRSPSSDDHQADGSSPPRVSLHQIPQDQEDREDQEDQDYQEEQEDREDQQDQEDQED